MGSTLPVSPQHPLPLTAATEALASTKTLVTSTLVIACDLGAVALFRGDSFLRRLNPLICKLVPKTIFMEARKALSFFSSLGWGKAVGSDSGRESEGSFLEEARQDQNQGRGQ